MWFGGSGVAKYSLLGDLIRREYSQGKEDKIQNGGTKLKKIIAYR